MFEYERQVVICFQISIFEPLETTHNAEMVDGE